MNQVEFHADHTSSRRLIEANGVELCIQTLGDPADPPLLLIHGAAASMLGWPDQFLDRLVIGGVFVIRYDHRDSGQSTSYEPGKPEYNFRTLVDDAIAILDHLEVQRAHVLGASMGGSIGQVIAVEHPDRLLSLTLMSTSSGEEGLPPPSPEFIEHVSSATHPDWEDEEAVVDHVVGFFQAVAGKSVALDEAAIRKMLVEDIRRSTASPASMHLNHFIIEHGESVLGRLSEIVAPTLIVHGEQDVLFPIEHAYALGRAIPDARVKVIDAGSHVMLWQTPEAIADVILDHVGAASIVERR